MSPNPILLPKATGATVKITGTNMDLISKVTFAGEKDGTIEDGGTATEINVKVPANAGEGKVTFTTFANKTVESTMVLELVKPVITNITPSVIMAGETITITGTNLDLVDMVLFEGGTRGEITDTTAIALEVASLSNSQSGAITLVTLNGEEIVSVQLITINSDLPVITSFLDPQVKPGAKLTLIGTKLNMVESIFLLDVDGNEIKAIKYGIRDETLMEVYIPENAKRGNITLTLIAFDGQEVISPEFAVVATDPIQDPSYIFFDFDGKGSWWGSFGSIEDDPALSLDGSKYFRINGNLTGGWIDFFWRNGANDLKTDGVTVADWVIKMDVNVLGPTTPKFKFRLKGTDGDFWAFFGGLENQAGWYTVTIPLTSFVDGDGYGTNQMPNVQNINEDFGLALAGEGETNICIDNIRFEQK
jgi:hypothetical protein